MYIRANLFFFFLMFGRGGWAMAPLCPSVDPSLLVDTGSGSCRIVFTKLRLILAMECNYRHIMCTCCHFCRGNVPSQTLDFLLGSRTSQTHFLEFIFTPMVH